MPDVVLVLPTVGQGFFDGLLNTVVGDYLELLFDEIIAERIAQLFDFFEQFVFLPRFGLDNTIVGYMYVRESLIA